MHLTDVLMAKKTKTKTLTCSNKAIKPACSVIEMIDDEWLWSSE